MRHVELRTVIEINQKDIDAVENMAAQLLDKVGLGLDLHEGLQRLAGHPYTRLKNNRVFFDGDYILEILASLHRPLPESANHPLRVSAGGGALDILDHRTSELRKPSIDDLLLTLRVCDRLGLGGDPPVIPADVPMPLRELILFRLAWENTQEFTGRDITTLASGEYIFEMAQVTRKPVNIPLYLINPLRVNSENLALILHFADRLPSLSLSTMPMPGATAPLLAPGYLAQTLAEMIGGYTLLSILFPEKRVLFGSKVLAFNPYSGSIACGSPESLLQGQMEIALLSRYGILPTHFFWSMAGGCDLQAAAERMAGVLMGALAGVRSFGVAGRLQGEAFSLEMLLIDLEIAAYVERLLQGQAWDMQDTAWLSEIQEAIRAGTFLGVSSTAEHYRQEITKPALFTRMSLAQRQANDEKSLRDRIHERLDSLDIPPPEYLSPEVKAELSRICRHAEKRLY